MRKYRKRSDCPARFASLVEKLNALPDGIGDVLKSIDRDEAAICKLVESLPNELRTLLNSEDPEGQIAELEELIRARRMLREIADRQPFRQYLSEMEKRVTEKAKELKEKGEEIKLPTTQFNTYEPEWEDAIRELGLAEYRVGNLKTLLRWRAITESEDFMLRSSLTVKNGRLALDHGEFFTCVSEEDIDVERILRCPVCENIFWAKKLNAKTCGEQFCIDRFQYLRKKRKGKISRKNKRGEITEERVRLRKEFLAMDFSKKG